MNWFARFLSITIDMSQIGPQEKKINNLFNQIDKNFHPQQNKKLPSAKVTHISEQARRLQPFGSNVAIALASFYLVGGWTNPSEKYARQIGEIVPK